MLVVCLAYWEYCTLLVQLRHLPALDSLASSNASVEASTRTSSSSSQGTTRPSKKHSKGRKRSGSDSTTDAPKMARTGVQAAGTLLPLRSSMADALQFASHPQLPASHQQLLHLVGSSGRTAVLWAAVTVGNINAPTHALAGEVYRRFYHTALCYQYCICSAFGVSGSQVPAEQQSSRLHGMLQHQQPLHMLLASVLLYYAVAQPAKVPQPDFGVRGFSVPPPATNAILLRVQQASSATWWGQQQQQDAPPAAGSHLSAAPANTATSPDEGQWQHDVYECAARDIMATVAAGAALLIEQFKRNGGSRSDVQCAASSSNSSSNNSAV